MALMGGSGSLFFLFFEWDGLSLAALRFAVFMNLLVTGSHGWTPPLEGGKFVVQAGGKTEL